MQRFATTTSRKVLFVLYGTLLVLGVALIAWLHSGQKRTIRQEAASRLSGITGTLATQLDGDRVRRLLANYDSRGMLVRCDQDPWYYVLHEALRRSAEASTLEAPLRLVAYDVDKQELQIVVSSEKKPVLRDAVESPSAKSMIDHLIGARIGPERLQAKDRVTVLDPVRDGTGAIVALLVGEQPVHTLDRRATTRLWRNIGLFSVAFVVIGIFLFRSVGRMVKGEEDAHSALRTRHDGVNDSIAYAGKIQGALIPKPERFREMFDDFFVLNRPKDLVSGDFHWYQRIDEHCCYVATADCTGHGFPGAMMAAIGCSLLNELVGQHPHADPAELLGALNQRMVHALDQSGRKRGAGDGMDIALCRIDRKQHEILFAGAFRPLYWMHQGQITVINGDRQPIGGSHHDPARRFTVHRVAYHPGDRIYLFSDGYVDQFGGPERRKFMTARFSDLLLTYQHLPLEAQHDLLERTFLEWKGSEEQVDDVCVLGIAV